MPHIPDLLREACFIGGAWLPTTGKKIAVHDPATGVVVGHVPDFGAAETRAAIAAAHDAFPAWAARVARERGHLLRRWYELIVAHTGELAALMTREQGKPLAEAKGEIAYAASFVRFYAEEAVRAYGETIPGHQADARLIVIQQPVGVVGCITPWNFPAAMITRKLAPALAAGCTAVLKPAGQTPFTALALAALAEEAGIPAGVINIVTGAAAPIGDTLCADPRVRKISFTGSTAIGKQLAAKAAGTVKKISLELGGNAPFLVFDDADLDAAVEGAMAAKFRNAGQACVAANRFLVQAGIYDAFAAKLVTRVQALKVGNGMEEGVTIGPLINQAAIDKLHDHLSDAIAKGAKILTGGTPHALGGNFFTPTVLGEATPAMVMSCEETFGPLMGLTRFTTEEEAVRLANDTPFGLAAYFYTRDLARGFRVAERLESGMVGINAGMVSVETAPFGGVKESGIGREGSRHGLDDYMELKFMCFGGIGADE